MPPKNNLPLGNYGETIAVNYLKSHGFQIIERNYRKRYKEIDIVCLDHKTLVFVEVKTRKSDSFGLPKEAITPWKLRSLIQAAHYYKLLHPNLPESLRIDLLSLKLSAKNQVETIELIKNITS